MGQYTPDMQGGPSAPTVFSADRIDILNVDKLLFSF